MILIKNTLNPIKLVGINKDKKIKVDNGDHTMDCYPSNLESFKFTLRGYPVVINYSFSVVKINGITEDFITLLNLRDNIKYELFDFTGITNKELKKILNHISCYVKKKY